MKITVLKALEKVLALAKEHGDDEEAIASVALIEQLLAGSTELSISGVVRKKSTIIRDYIERGFHPYQFPDRESGMLKAIDECNGQSFDMRPDYMPDDPVVKFISIELRRGQ